MPLYFVDNRLDGINSMGRTLNSHTGNQTDYLKRRKTFCNDSKCTFNTEKKKRRNVHIKLVFTV